MPKESETVFVEGETVITSASPYEKYKNAEFEYITDRVSKNSANVSENKRCMRLECVKLAVMANPVSITAVCDKNTTGEDIITLAKRFYYFAKTGE
jgi:hypothetical protein